MSRRVLVGVDGSEGSRRALEWATEEATLRGSPVEAVMVWRSPSDLPTDLDRPADADEAAQGVQARLEEAVTRALGGGPPGGIEPLVVEGDAAERLCERSADAALLVVGSRGHGPVTGLLLGSVSTKCAHHSLSPVVIVPARRGEDDGGIHHRTGRIVVGIDGSPGSEKAFRWALDEGAIRKATVQAVAVWRGVEADDDMALEWATFSSLARHERAAAALAHDRLERIVSGARVAPGTVVEPVLAEGDPAGALCSYADEADMLVVGSRGRGTVAGLLLGSVSTRCAHHSSAPVVIVPYGRGSLPSSPGEER